MMTCEEMGEMLQDFMDGRTPFTTSMSMRMHMVMCKHCKRYYQQTRQVISLTRTHDRVLDLEPNEDTGPSDQTRKDLLEAFRARNAG